MLLGRTAEGQRVARRARKCLVSFFKLEDQTISTRCQVDFYDCYRDLVTNRRRESLGARLYHHSDGNPDFMLGKLDRFLDAARDFIYTRQRHNWCAEMVATLMVMFSIEDYDKPLLPYSTNKPDEVTGHLRWSDCRPAAGIPVFKVAHGMHGDIAYLYKVSLSEGRLATVSYVSVDEQETAKLMKKEARKLRSVPQSVPRAPRLRRIEINP